MAHAITLPTPTNLQFGIAGTLTFKAGVGASLPLVSTGATGPVTWQLLDGDLNQYGLHLDPAGYVSGTPVMKVNNCFIKVRAVDQGTPPQADEAYLRLVIA